MATKNLKAKEQYIDGAGYVQEFPKSLPPSGDASGDLTGTYPDPQVNWENGLPFYNTQYINGSLAINTAEPLQGGGPLTENLNLSIKDAKADGTTKGAASFKASDFNDNGTGDISIDYTNGQSASATTKGFVTAADWNTFNGKQDYIAPGTVNQYWRGDKTWHNFPAIPTVTPSALTSTDDTNVTLTLGGTPATALLQAVSMTVGWTGTLADSRIASAATWNAKVSSVSGTAPIASSGGTTPTISISQATTSTDGYLSSADWNTFNNKGSGTVTSVSGTTGRTTSTGGTTPAIDLASGIATPGTTGSSSLIPVITVDTYGRITNVTTASNPQGTVTNVTGTSPISSSGGATPAISIQDAAADGSTKGAASFTASDFNSTSGVISIDYTNGQAASASAKGFLTSADWTTFNNKISGKAYVLTTDQTAVTGSTTNTKVYSMTIPANTVTVGTVWNITYRARKTGTSGTTSMRIYANTADSLTSATLIGTNTTGATTLMGQMQRSLVIKTAINSEAFPAATSGPTDMLNATVAASALNIDWTVTQYIIFAIQNSNNADSTVVSYAEFKTTY